MSRRGRNSTGPGVDTIESLATSTFQRHLRQSDSGLSFRSELLEMAVNV
jgi:hypothetical protein